MEWKPMIKTSSGGKDRLVYRCGDCGYLARRRTPYCPFCGKPKNKRGDEGNDTR